MSTSNSKIGGPEGKLDQREAPEKAASKFLESIPATSRPPQNLHDSVKSAFTSPVRAQFPARPILTSVQSGNNAPSTISTAGSPQTIITKTMVNRPVAGELLSSRPAPPLVSPQTNLGNMSSMPGATMTTATSSTMASIIRGPTIVQQPPSTAAHQGGHPAIQATYSTHVPRGVAAVACMTALKSAVATPVPRPSHIFGSNIVSSSGSMAPHIQPRASVLTSLRPSSSPMHAAIRTVAPLSLTSAAAEGIRPLTSHASTNPLAGPLLIANPRAPEGLAGCSTIVHGPSVVSKVHSYVQPFPQLPDKVFYKPITTTSASPMLGHPVPTSSAPPSHPSGANPHLLPPMSHHQQQQQRGAAPPTSNVGLSPHHRPQLVGAQLTSAALGGMSAGSPMAMTTMSSHGHIHQMPKVTVHSVSSMSYLQSASTPSLMSSLPRPVLSTAPISSAHCAPRPSPPTSAAVTSIPVAKVYPQPLALATRPSQAEVSSSSGGVGHNLDAPRGTPLFTNMPPGATSVGGVLAATSGVPMSNAPSRVTSSAQIMPPSVIFTDSRQERPPNQQASGQFTIQPAAYFYESYQPSVPNTLTMHPYPSAQASHSFTTLAAPTLRAGLLPSHPSSSITMHAPIRATVAAASTTAVTINPMVMTMSPGHPSLAVPVSFSASHDNAVAKPDSTTTATTTSFPHPSGAAPAAHTSSSTQPTSSSSSSNLTSSPRPSILRKRTFDGASAHVRKNLLASIPNSQPSSPRPDSSGLSTSNGTDSSKAPHKLRELSLENGQSSESADSNCNGIHPLNVVVKQEPPDTSESTSAASSSTSNSQVSNNVPLTIVGASPRKKPRKQQLTGNELIEMHSAEGEDDFEKLRKSIVKKEVVKEAHFMDEDGVRWVSSRKRPPIALLNGYRHAWKSRHNHFQRYSDVKPKAERRPTVGDIANQKMVLQKANGWKVHHICTQMDDLVGMESNVNSRLSAILNTMESKTGSKDDDQDLNRANEFLKGNIQRCKMIMDQMNEAKQQALKVMDHKSRIVDIVNKYIVKQPNKKRDKN